MHGPSWVIVHHHQQELQKLFYSTDKLTFREIPPQFFFFKKLLELLFIGSVFYFALKGS